MNGMGNFKKRSGSNNNTLANRMNNWKIKADEFYRSSEYLWIEINKDHSELINERKTENVYTRPYTPILDHTYFLLICLSIENLLKGLILYANPTLIANKLDKSISNHDLEKLSKFTTINFSDDENDFLIMASTIISWYSRYPIPRNANQIIQSANFDYNKIRNTYLQLFSKLSFEMKTSGGLTKNYDYVFSENPNRHLKKKS